jgi:NAD(P)-dependent dehydrogenase (short-subunit alcohol dehydrogenase family)
MKQLVLFVLTCLLSLSTLAQEADRSGAANQRAILVTGASSGIGKEIALMLSRRGFFVYAGARKAADIEALSSIENMRGIRLDVTVQADIAAAVETIEQSGRGLYGLVNNAGVFVFDPLIEASERDMQFVMDVNVFGPYRVTKAFAPLLIEHRGRITTIGSLSGIFSGPLMGPYGMSKHAVESFTDSLADEMSKFDVHVSVVEPGNFRSNIMKNMRRRMEQIESGERRSLFEPEITRFADFTQSDRSRHVPPTPVAEAVYDFMTSTAPKRRYLVAPTASEAHYAIRRALQRVEELNRDQPFTLSREALIDLLDELLDTAVSE